MTEGLEPPLILHAGNLDDYVISKWDKCKDFFGFSESLERKEAYLDDMRDQLNDIRKWEKALFTFNEFFACST